MSIRRKTLRTLPKLVYIHIDKMYSTNLLNQFLFRDSSGKDKFADFSEMFFGGTMMAIYCFDLTTFSNQFDVLGVNLVV